MREKDGVLGGEKKGNECEKKRKRRDVISSILKLT